MKRRLFIIAFAVAILAILVISSTAALGGGIVNDPRVCGPLSGMGSGPAAPVYGALCVDDTPVQLPPLP